MECFLVVAFELYSVHLGSTHRSANYCTCKCARGQISLHHYCHIVSYDELVGGFNPFEKYARQIGSFPQGSG